MNLTKKLILKSKMIQISNQLMESLLIKGFIQTDKFTIVSDEVMNSTLNDLQKSLSATDFDIVKANRGHLVKKVVTDKNGRQKTVWVNPNEKVSKKKEKKDEIKSLYSLMQGKNSFDFENDIGGFMNVENYDRHGEREYIVYFRDGRKTSSQRISSEKKVLDIIKKYGYKPKK